MSVNRSSDSSLVTLKVLSGNFIRFEIDTGAPCNVLPIHIYKKPTGDCDLKRVTPAKSSIVSYDGGNVPVLGTVKLQVWRGSFTVIVSSRGKQALPSYIGQVSLRRDWALLKLKILTQLGGLTRVVIKCFLSKI